MNLQKLFKTQQELEEHINAQHPLQEGKPFYVEGVYRIAS